MTDAAGRTKVKLDDEFYIETDAMNFVLVRKHTRESKSHLAKSDVIEETNRMYFATLFGLFKGYRNEKQMTSISSDLSDFITIDNEATEDIIKAIKSSKMYKLMEEAGLAHKVLEPNDEKKTKVLNPVSQVNPVVDSERKRGRPKGSKNTMKVTRPVKVTKSKEVKRK